MWLKLPETPVTVIVYVPAGVRDEPPHDMHAANASAIAGLRAIQHLRFLNKNHPELNAINVNATGIASGGEKTPGLALADPFVAIVAAHCFVSG